MEDRGEMDSGVSSWTSCCTGSGSERDFEFENAGPGLLFSLVLVRLYCTVQQKWMDGWMDQRRVGELIRVEEWTASCFPRVLD